MRSILRYAAISMLFALLAASGCRQAPPPASTPEVVLVSAPSVPIDPADPAWNAAPEHIAKLIPQDLVEPRLMTSSTETVRVRAVTNGADAAFRLEWTSASKNDLPGPNKFCDACAIQVPGKAEPTVPAPQMGESGRPVEITYWNAAWQAVVDGRGDTIQDIYPRAAVDHYPFEAKSLEKGSAAQIATEARYAPARALGNRMAGPRKTPVQDLIAEGPGTLMPTTTADSKGRGTRTPRGWSVVIVRKLPDGLATDLRSQIAFAVWEGSRKEAGSRKMRTGWISLVMKVK